MIDAVVAHPSERLLQAHASGWIPAAAELCVRTHVEGCSACRGAIQRLEEREAEFADRLPTKPEDAAEADALMALLEATPPQPEAEAPRRRLGDVELPRTLARTPVGRRRWLMPGLWAAPLQLSSDDDWRAFVLRLPAGQGLPTHGHSGPELICVLSGSVRAPTVFSAGDFIEVSAETNHRLQVTDEGPCACLVAVKGPLRWRGMARVLNPALLSS